MENFPNKVGFTHHSALNMATTNTQHCYYVILKKMHYFIQY